MFSGAKAASGSSEERNTGALTRMFAEQLMCFFGAEVSAAEKLYRQTAAEVARIEVTAASHPAKHLRLFWLGACGPECAGRPLWCVTHSSLDSMTDQRGYAPPLGQPAEDIWFALRTGLRCVTQLKMWKK